MRVFAGPNGSGKSSIIRSISEFTVGNKALDFGVYINADDIATALRKTGLDFTNYRVQISKADFLENALNSGLIGKRFTENDFKSSFKINGNKLHLLKPKADEGLAQVVADYLRKKLLQHELKFSFETVFSHSSKLEIMKEARDAGYKVYLYFVATESPYINMERVLIRVEKKGHSVPEHLTIARYYRSLDLMYDAAQIAHSAFFFDNTYKKPVLFAHFKRTTEGKKWTIPGNTEIPNWFQKFYSDKSGQ